MHCNLRPPDDAPVIMGFLCDAHYAPAYKLNNSTTSARPYLASGGRAAGSCPKHWSNKPDWLTASHGARCVSMSQLYFGTLTGCHTLSTPSSPGSAQSSRHSADYPTRRGSVVQVALTRDGWTRVATTTTVHPLTCGEMLSGEVIPERRNGPRRLSDNDDALWMTTKTPTTAYP